MTLRKKHIILFIVLCLCFEVHGQVADTISVKDSVMVADTVSELEQIVLSPKELKAKQKEADRILKEKRSAEKKARIKTAREALLAKEEIPTDTLVTDTTGTDIPDTVEVAKKPSYTESLDTLVMPDMEYFTIDDSTMMAEGKILKAPPAKKERNPAHAAFLSALIPGAGQIYGRAQWWMAPIFWGGMTGTMMAVSWYNSYYNDFRTEYKYRINTGKVNSFEYFDNDALVNRMQQAEQQRDLWILATAGIYLLNILHANVAVQLSEFKTQRKHREALEREEIMKTLTFQPTIITPGTGIDRNAAPGLSLTLSF
ncbi:MAG: DUF5683 domain-containing protein [Flavobacteriales bacterium]|nr:DUF5683 domain-containing protein [Flavobacteriales bacterium]